MSDADDALQYHIESRHSKADGHAGPQRVPRWTQGPRSVAEPVRLGIVLLPCLGEGARCWLRAARVGNHKRAVAAKFMVTKKPGDC